MPGLGKRVLRHFGLSLRRGARVSLFRTPVHYLHIGKNAGTQIGHVIAQVNAAQAKLQLVKHGHGTVLAHLPEDEPYFFSIRDPMARFKSGFYSRKRMGQPRLYNPWSKHERIIFEEFEHATDLAEALFEPGQRGQRALAAMLTIGHMGAGQVDWFKKGGNIFELRQPVWIIRQSSLEADLVKLLQRLGIEHKVALTRDPVAAHANDYSAVPELSAKAVENLRRWHAPDFVFYQACENWIAAQEAAASGLQL